MALPFTFVALTKIQSSQVDANFTYLDNSVIALGITVAGFSGQLAGKLTAANNLSDVASASVSRTNLGLGTAAVANTGTSGHTLPFLDGVNAWSSTNTFPTQAPLDGSTKAATTAYADAAAAKALIRSYLAGLTLSTAGASATFGIAAGVAADSTNVSMMSLATAYTKTTSPWAVGSGSGALDVGVSIINNRWYHTYLIQRPDTGVVDVLVSQAPANSGTATITIASPAVVTQTNHGLQISAPVSFSTTGALPTGITAGVTYFVLTVPTVNTYTISASQGGAAINTTGSQSGVHTATSNPILPTNYTLSRRVGSMLTDGSGQWVRFVQNGDLFQWGTPTFDVNSGVVGTSALLFQINTPSAISALAYMVGFIINAVQYGVLISSPLTTDTAPVSLGLGFSAVGSGNDYPISVQIQTDQSQQIRARSTAANTTVGLTTQAWLDRRGRDN